MYLDQQLSAHFHLREFVKSPIAEYKGFDNTPPPFVVENIKLLCDRALEPIWDYFGPVHILFGYCCNNLNELIGGFSNSQHVKGQAADIEVYSIPNEELGAWIETNCIDWDQLVYEFTDPPRPLSVPKDPHAGWIHISYTNGRNRKMVLRK